MQNVFFKRDKNGNCLSLSLSLRDKNAFLSVPQNCPGEGQKRDFRFVRDRDKNVYINIHCLLSLTGQGGKEVVRKLSHDSFLPLSLTKGKFETKQERHEQNGKTKKTVVKHC